MMARYLIFLFMLIHLVLAKKNPGREPPPIIWPTLDGKQPMVVARGGNSGFYPESCYSAFENADEGTSIIYSDLQISKDGKAVLQRDIRLNNSTNIAKIYPKREKTYDVNGEQVRGYFAVDYTAKQLEKVWLVQNIMSRSDFFDEDVPLLMTSGIEPMVPYWFNVPYYTFYKTRNVDVVATVAETTKTIDVAVISSPEIEFMRSIAGRVETRKTILIFQIPDVNLSKVEPTTKQTYGQILKNLSSIGEYAAGILVPKQLIWPVNGEGLLEPMTSLIDDAHKQRLLVFPYGFANDFFGSYNYSYDPEAEYLKFIGNSKFAVDGVVTDFATSARIALDCFARNITNKSVQGGPLIISHGGASGVYPSSTDLAYQQAIEDGADIIDCSVALSKDGVPFCLPSVDLKVGTSAVTTLISKSTSIPEILPSDAIFSFDCTASEIQSLTPVISTFTPGLLRHQENKNKGRLITLHEFLDIAKTKAVSGILVHIENAAYLASKKGLSVTDIVAKELANATFDKQVTQKVFIQSEDTSVLSYFKNVTSYKKVFVITDKYEDVDKQSVDEIKKVADAVNIPRTSIIPTTKKYAYTLNTTQVVDTMHTANISVYVGVLRNEFATIPFDMRVDPYVELATFIVGVQVDGVITDYPATASAYRRSPCYEPFSKNIPLTVPGSFITEIAPILADAPLPTLHPENVTDPPLPPVLDIREKSPSDGPSNAPTKNAQPANAANVGFSLILMMVLGYLLN